MADVVQTVKGSMLVVGEVIASDGATVRDGAITNAKVAADAAIAASKCQRSLTVTHFISGDAADGTILLRRLLGVAEIIHFRVTNLTACVGASTVSVDLQNDGASVLNAPIELNAATGDLGDEAGVITEPTGADEELLTAVITTSESGTDALANGLLIQVELNEAYAAT